jgi:predicted esterase
MTRSRIRLCWTILIVAVLGWALSAPLVTEAPMTEVVLAGRWAQAYQREDWSLATEIGRQLCELAPHEPRHCYNLACVHARRGDVQAAIRWLERAAARGFDDPRQLRDDPDLESLSVQRDFEPIRAQVLANHEVSLEAFKRRADRSTPLVILPPRLEPDESACLIVALHGYGGRARDMAEIWRDAAARARAILVVPQSFIAIGPGYRWGKLEEAEYLVEHAIDHVVESHHVDTARIVLTGFSQGGSLAFYLGLKRPDRIAGLIPVGAYADEATLKHARVDGLMPRIFIMVGDEDPALDGCRRTARALEDAGFDVKLNVYPGVAHAFPRSRETELDRALAFVLQSAGHRAAEAP